MQKLAEVKDILKPFKMFCTRILRNRNANDLLLLLFTFTFTAIRLTPGTLTKVSAADLPDYIMQMDLQNSDHQRWAEKNIFSAQPHHYLKCSRESTAKLRNVSGDIYTPRKHEILINRWKTSIHIPSNFHRISRTRSIWKTESNRLVLISVMV